MRRVVIPADAAAALRELQLLDSDTERLVFRAEADEAGVALLVVDDDLDALVGCVATEANHEENRRRQRRLDDAFRILSAALDAPRPLSGPAYPAGQNNDGCAVEGIGAPGRAIATESGAGAGSGAFRSAAAASRTWR